MDRKTLLAAAVLLGLGLAGGWGLLGKGTRAQGTRDRPPDAPEVPDRAGSPALVLLAAVAPGEEERGAIPRPAEADALLEPDPSTGRLAVQDDDTRAPIAGARVWLDTVPIGTTDGEGHLRVPVGGAEAVTLRVEAEGYAHFDGRVSFPFWTPERDGEVELSPAVALRGRVLDALTRAVVPGARMRQHFDLCDCPPAEIAVDAQGRFEIAGLPRDGQVTLEVEAEGYPRTWREIWLEERVSASEQDVLLTRGRLVVGRVEDWETGVPLAGASVGGLTTDENGVFRGLLALVPGTEAAGVTATAEGYAEVSGRLDLAAGGPFVIRLPRLAKVVCWIDGPGEGPASGVRVRLEARGVKPVWPDEGMPGVAFGRLSRSFDPDDSATTDASGRATLLFTPWARELTLVAGGTEKRVPRIGPPGSTTEVTMTLRDAPPEPIVVSGRIDFDPGISWPVLVRWRNANESGELRVQGSYRFVPDEGGDLTLEFEPVGRPELLQRHTLPIPANGFGSFRRDVRFAFSAGSLSGRVEYPDGRPVADAYVSARQEWEDPVTGGPVRAGTRTVTDAEGRFRMSVADVGEYLVQATHRGSRDGREHVKPGTGGVTLRLDERVDLLVRCLDARERSLLRLDSRVDLYGRRAGEAQLVPLTADSPDASGLQRVLVPTGRSDLLFLPDDPDLLDHAPTWVRGIEAAGAAPIEVLLERVEPVALTVPLDAADALNGRLVVVEAPLADLLQWTGSGWTSRASSLLPRARPTFDAGGRAELRGLANGTYVLRLPPGAGRVHPDRIQVGPSRRGAIALSWSAD